MHNTNQNAIKNSRKIDRQPETQNSTIRSVVLVVEDHALIRQAAVEIVNAAGFDALEARNADEAIKILETRTDIRLVFTDVEMPGTMDGLKLVHHIRDRWPPIQLMIASGRAILAESQLPAGAMFFSKPYDEASIVQTMTVMLAKSAA